MFLCPSFYEKPMNHKPVHKLWRHKRNYVPEHSVNDFCFHTLFPSPILGNDGWKTWDIGLDTTLGVL